MNDEIKEVVERKTQTKQRRKRKHKRDNPDITNRHKQSRRGGSCITYEIHKGHEKYLTEILIRKKTYQAYSSLVEFKSQRAFGKCQGGRRGGEEKDEEEEEEKEDKKKHNPAKRTVKCEGKKKHSWRRWQKEGAKRKRRGNDWGKR